MVLECVFLFCCRQESFMESYIASQRESIFRNVEVLIYVFDVESRELERDFHYYQSCLEAILQNSADAKIFCLIHKMDLIHQDEADRVMRCFSSGYGLAFTTRQYQLRHYVFGLSIRRILPFICLDRCCYCISHEWLEQSR